MTIEELLAEATRLGVYVTTAALEEDLLGYYEHRFSRIVMARGLTEAEFRCTLGHELAHAWAGHECGLGGNERQARRKAAHYLIRAADYATAERQNPDAGYIARELGVTRRVVEDYQAWLATSASDLDAVSY